MPRLTVSSSAAATGEPEWSSAERLAFRRAALRWFREHARDLPWRRDRDPYGVWLSEIMLQQTQVATVIGYYNRFRAALPTVEALASADEQQVLRLWEGLGYYRRARQLHRAAKQVVDQHGGRVPSDVQQLQQLPGIGRYTAGAVASIAFDVRAPILEANTIRLLARLLAERRSVEQGAVRERLWAAATEILPREQVGQFNQALMEIGSLICGPRNPQCADCPLARWCRARALGLQDQVPPPPRRTRFEQVVEAAIVVRQRGRVLVRQCADGQRWAGLWDFPRITLTGTDEEQWLDQIRQQGKAVTGVTIEPGSRLATLRHGVTRFRITLHCYAARSRSTKTRAAPALRWLRVSELSDLPLSVTGRRIALILRDGLAPADLGGTHQS